jgi:hypothetical protein
MLGEVFQIIRLSQVISIQFILGHIRTVYVILGQVSSG